MVLRKVRLGEEGTTKPKQVQLKDGKRDQCNAPQEGATAYHTQGSREADREVRFSTEGTMQQVWEGATVKVSEEGARGQRPAGSYDQC